MYFWPTGIPRLPDRESFVKAFGSLGYSVCEREVLEEGVEKVVLYESGGKVKHAARQIVSGPFRGLWTSKLGGGIDIVHSLRGVCGTLYGTVSVILQRAVKQGN
jgi:hypothetical protein